MRVLVTIVAGIVAGIYFCDKGSKVAGWLFLFGVIAFVIGVLGAVIFGYDLSSVLRLQGVLGAARPVALGYSIILASMMVFLCQLWKRIDNK